MTNRIAVFYDNVEFKTRIEYVFNFIFSHYFIENQKIKIDFNPKEFLEPYIHVIDYLEKPSNNSIYIKPQNIIFSSQRIDSKLLVVNQYSYDDTSLYSVEDKKQQLQNFINMSKMNFDIIEMIFFHISRYEEYHAKDIQLDNHQRMMSSEQLLVRAGLNKVPVVDHLVYAFLNILGFVNLDIKSTYSMTHDIDALRKFPSLYKFIRALARLTIKEKDPLKTYKLIKQYANVLFSGKDTYDTFDRLLSLNMSKEKVIYFMSGGTTKFDNFYSIKDKRLENIFQSAKSHGYVFGLHPSYATPFEREQFEKEINLLENTIDQQIKNTRQHILHFAFEDTIDILESLDVKFDSTLGYQDLLGFRCGTGHNYYLYNFNKEKVSTVQEIPLVVMDGPLLMEAKYDVENAREVVFNFLNLNKQYTKITFNFHNSTFDDVVCNSVDLKELYREINEYIKV